MTRYGFASKALPKGGKPFGHEDDDEIDEDLAEEPEGAPDASVEDPMATSESAEPAEELETPEADVDDAQMTRTHSNADAAGSAPAADTGQQDQMFPTQ